MGQWPRYRVRCTTTTDCSFAVSVHGPETHARSPMLWVLARAHADQAHRGVHHPTAFAVNCRDPADYAELLLG